MNGNVKSVLDGILEKFRTGDIPEAVAIASFPALDIPSNRWSFTNRILVVLSGTFDARGFRQWREVHRWVTKGAKAIHILVPCFKKEVDEETGEDTQILRFFKSAPVFKYEDTDGKPLEHLELELPELPLIERARQWGISVKAIPGNYRFRGYYVPEQKEIALAAPEEKTFFHELAHVSHEKIKGGIKTGQDPLQEIVAELSAQALCKLVGKQLADTTGNSHKYIQGYAEELKLSPYTACLRVLTDTEKVLNLILTGVVSNSERKEVSK